MIKKISLPIQLLIVIAAVITLGSFVPTPLVQGLYTFSLTFKELLSLFLPAIVFSFILTGILSFKKNAPLILLILLGTIICSNLLVSLISFFMGTSTLGYLTQNIDANALIINDSIQPFFSFSFPTLVRAEHAMLAAITLGIIFSYFRNQNVHDAANTLKGWVECVLKKFFIPLLPLYVLGFLLKLFQEGAFFTLFSSYGSAFMLIVATQILYLGFMYFAVSGFKYKTTLTSISNAIPSYLTAFSSMSSSATIPVTVEGAVKNTKNVSLSHTAIPIMASVHLLGDTVTIPILALVTMSLFLGVVPSIITYLTFVLYMCMTMLAGSGIPGGSIILVIPILQSILGFTPEMISIITTLYLLQDCFATAANVTGDGALVILVNNILKKLKISTD